MTKTLRNGYEVTAKPYEGKPYAVTYANRTQAQRALASMPPRQGWEVYQFGRPFYVGRLSGSPAKTTGEG